MATLLLVQGPGAGKRYPLKNASAFIGRQPDVDIHLDALDVSRYHARITGEEGKYFIEDLSSSNGTFVNSVPLARRAEMHDRDQIKVGPYLFVYEAVGARESEVLIQSQISVDISNPSLFKLDAGRKLQAVLEIAQALARVMDLNELMPRLLDHLLRLFLQGDRALVLMREGEQVVVRAMRSRKESQASGPVYSRTVVNRVMEEGIGIVAADARIDQRFVTTATLNVLGIRSFLCVPLMGRNGKALGVVQIDRFGAGAPFREDDLHLLTAISFQAAVVLENAAMHADLLRQERLKRDLALAREIQQGFLPQDFSPFPKKGVELFAQVFPARDVSGDFYDCFDLEDGRLGFIIADVSGKGMPAALFMVAVRTLGRHLASHGESPAAVLQTLNDTLAADNPAGMFVTMTLGWYHPLTGELILSSAGHPPAFCRRADGAIEQVPLKPGRVLGFSAGPVPLDNTSITVEPGESVILYTDGVTEALSPDGQTMFGDERMVSTLSQLPGNESLESWSNRIKTAVDQFTTAAELSDDVTLLLLRRPQ